MLAFREILINAIEHGAEFRPGKVIDVAAVHTERTIVFYVHDPGSGFRWESLEHAAIGNPDGDVARHVKLREQKGMRPGGFGILIAKGVVERTDLQRSGKRSSDDQIPVVNRTIRRTLPASVSSDEFTGASLVRSYWVRRCAPRSRPAPGNRCRFPSASGPDRDDRSVRWSTRSSSAPAGLAPQHLYRHLHLAHSLLVCHQVSPHIRQDEVTAVRCCPAALSRQILRRSLNARKSRLFWPAQ